MRSTVMLGLLLGVTCGAATVWAQTGAGVEQSYESPQRFWFEFKLGPYVPDIDAEFGGGAAPYRKVFGDPGRNVIFNAEAEVEVWRPFGTLAVGGSFGFFQNTAAAVAEETGEPTGSESALQIFPLALLVVYRFDYAADRWRVPLVPYLKVGLNYTFWRMLLDGETAEFTPTGGKPIQARGGTFGWQLNAGLAFRLDIIERSAARALDMELGINHTYLFFELAHIAADGLGSSSALRLGDTSWCGGLAFEF